MRLRLSGAQLAFREEACEWLSVNAARRSEADVPTIFTAVDATIEKECRAWQATKADAGWAYPTWPTEHGGRGLGPVEHAIFYHEESKYVLPPSGPSGFGLLCGLTLMAHGGDDQKRLLDPTRRGECIWALMFSEANAGSNLGALETTARETSNGWVLDGEKSWISGAQYADHALCAARVDGDRSLSIFILDLREPGIEIAPQLDMTGMHHFSTVRFSGLHLPREAVVGAPGLGDQVLRTLLMHDRAFIGAGLAGWGGLAAGSVPGTGAQAVARLARALSRGGTSLADDAAVRTRVASLVIEELTIRLLSCFILFQASGGALVPGENTPNILGSAAKLAYSVHQRDVAVVANELLATSDRDAPTPKELERLEGAWSDALFLSPAVRLGGGADEIQRDILAKELFRPL